MPAAQKRKPGRPAPDGRKIRVTMTLDEVTLDLLAAIQAKRPELESLSATVRYLIREYLLSPQPTNGG